MKTENYNNMKIVFNTKFHNDHVRDSIRRNKHLVLAVIISILIIIGTILKIGLKNITRYLPIDISSSRSVSSVDEVEGESSKTYRRQAVAGETYNPDADKNTEVVKYQKTDAQREKLKKSLMKIVIMQNLYPEQLEEVLDAFFLKTVSAGDYVIKEGDKGDYFYVIDKGVFSVMKGTKGQEKVIQKYNDSGSFGELALLYSIPRSASVKAENDGILWALDSKTFRRIIIKSAYKNRKNYIDLIKNVKILSHLTEMERMNLADNLVRKAFKDGEVILSEGDSPDGMYFVIEGQVMISKKVNDKVVPLKTVEKGGYFGELALLTNAKRAATAVAKGNVATAFLDAQAFIRLMGPCEEAMRANLEKYGMKKDNIV